MTVDPEMVKQAATTPAPEVDVPTPTFPDTVEGPAVSAAGALSYEGCIVRVMQLMGAIDAEPITPDLALSRIQQGLQNFDTQTRVLHETLDNQNNVLVALAKLSKLKEGSFFSDMIAIFESWTPPPEA